MWGRISEASHTWFYIWDGSESHPYQRTADLYAIYFASAAWAAARRAMGTRNGLQLT